MSLMQIGAPAFSVKPASSSLPSWVTDIGVGTRANVSLNKITDVDPNLTPGTFPAYGLVEGIMDFGGVTFTTHLGTAGSLLVGAGGGHGSYSGNEAYRYDVETRLWSRLTTPYTPTYLWDHTISAPWAGNYSDLVLVGSYGGGPVNSYGEMWTDATCTATHPDQPTPAHNYDNQLCVPPGVLGSGAYGGLVIPSQYGISWGPAVSTMSHMLDLETNVWSRCANNEHMGQTGASTCYVSSLGKMFHANAYVAGKMSQFDVATGLWSELTLSTTAVNHYFYYGNIRYIESLGLLMYYRTSNTETFHLIDPTSGQVYEPGLTGSGPSVQGGGEWIEEWQQFVYYEGHGGNTVYRLTPSASPTTLPWVWSSETLSGTAAPDCGPDDHESRLRWVPEYEIFLWIANSYSNVQGWKLAAP